MSKKSPVQYQLLSTFHGRAQPVGIPIPLEGGSRTPDCVRVPVETGMDSNWTTTSPQIAPGPIRLGVLPLKYTMGLNGQVYATNDRTADKEWYLAPGDENDTYIIGTDKNVTNVWTVVDDKIMIAPVGGDPYARYGQLFQFYSIS